MKETAIIMHPAPFNRGVEIADEVVECASRGSSNRSTTAFSFGWCAEMGDGGTINELLMQNGDVLYRGKIRKMMCWWMISDG
ncbi:MAG: hypothetical protein ACLSA6_11835 [Holdemania massiliensis]